MELFLLAAVLVVIVSAVAGRLGVAAPLVLVVVGVAVSFLPFVPQIEVEPEWILGGVLPPLLYSAAVALPTMDFRRDFAVISGLAVLLVIIGSLLMGLLFWQLLPGLSLWGGIAIGAVVSPTDAVATKIVKRVGAPSRIVTMLEGEGMLNDATALVLLQTAAGASIAAVTFGHIAWSFVWSILAATVCGAVVGWLGLLGRRKIRSAALTTAVSFIVPFAALAPAEAVGASGLVAAVVAGLVTGHFAPRYLTARERVFDYTNWETIETVLENAIFFLMGLELATLIEDVHGSQNMLVVAIWLALVTLVLSLLIRAAYVLPLVAVTQRKARRLVPNRERLLSAQERLSNFDPDDWQRRVADERDRLVGGLAGARGQVPTRSVDPERLQTRIARMARRVQRRVADTDYLLARPIARPEGFLLVFAGLRGVVTLAGAQSLPRAFPDRSFVILLAFLVAASSLLIQGTLLPTICRRLGVNASVALAARDSESIHRDLEQEAAAFLDSPDLVGPDGAPYDPAVVDRVRAHVIPADDGESDSLAMAQHHTAYRELWVRTIDAQRERLLRENDLGTYDADALAEAFSALDAEQMMIEMKPAAWLDTE